MKSYLQDGVTITLPAPRDLHGCEVVVVGVLAGIAVHDALSGAPVEVETTGCFSVAKATGQAWDVGDAIYVIPGTGVCTTAKTAGNLFLGAAIEAALSAASSGDIRLNGAASAAVTT